MRSGFPSGRPVGPPHWQVTPSPQTMACWRVKPAAKARPRRLNGGVESEDGDEGAGQVSGGGMGPLGSTARGRLVDGGEQGSEQSQSGRGWGRWAARGTAAALPELPRAFLHEVWDWGLREEIRVCAVYSDIYTVITCINVINTLSERMPTKCKVPNCTKWGGRAA